MLRILLPALVLVLMAHAALADCADDIADLQHKIGIAPDKQAPNVLAAQNDLTKAQDPMADEVSCENYVARAWQAFHKPPPDADPDAAEQPVQPEE